MDEEPDDEQKEFLRAANQSLLEKMMRAGWVGGSGFTAERMAAAFTPKGTEALKKVWSAVEELGGDFSAFELAALIVIASEVSDQSEGDSAQ